MSRNRLASACPRGEDFMIGRTETPIRRPMRRFAGGLATVLAMLGVMLGGASNAWAGIALAVPPDIPTTVTVGTTIASTVSVVNNNNGVHAALSNTIDPGSITLVPSCGAPPLGGDCPAGSVDPGVLIPSATGTGRAGSACENKIFTITLTDPTMGKYTFTWAGTITITPLGSGPTNECVIEFTTDVKRVPGVDASAATGLQARKA